MAFSDTSSEINTLEMMEPLSSSLSSSSSSLHQNIDSCSNSMLILHGTFFRYQPERSTSTTAAGLCTRCTKHTVIKGSRNTTSNFVSHLKRKHGEELVLEYKEYVNSKRKKTEVRQDSHKKFSQTKFDEAVTRFVIHSMVPLRVVKDPYFKSIFDNFSLHVMSRRSLGRRISSIFDNHCKQITEKISKVSFLCTTADIWSGRKRSFLGITAHYIDKDSDNCERKSVALVCRRFCNTDSYDRIAQMLRQINAEFGITSNKIVATNKDNGSNFMKAFKIYGVAHEHIDMHSVCNTQQDCASDSDTDSADDSEKEILMPEFNKLLSAHLKCCAHTLSLCVTNDAAKVLETSEDVLSIHREVMKKCNLLWKASMRPKTAEIIQEILGHTLHRPCATRWNSLYDCLLQIVNTKLKCCQLSKALKIDIILNENDFEYLEEHLTCTQLIAEAIDILQGENNTYYGITLPCLVALRRKLQLLSQREWTYCASLAKCFENSVENRFYEFFHFTSTAAEKVAIAALSYPRFKNRWLSCIEAFYHEDILNTFEKTVQMGMVPESEETPCTSSMSAPKEKCFFDFGTPPHQSHSGCSTSNVKLKIYNFLQRLMKILVFLHDIRK